MLGGIRHKILDAAHDVVEKGIAVDEAAEAGDLASDGSSDLSLVILEKLDKGGHEVSRHDLLIDSLGNL